MTKYTLLMRSILCLFFSVIALALQAQSFAWQRYHSPPPNTTVSTTKNGQLLEIQTFDADQNDVFSLENTKRGVWLVANWLDESTLQPRYQVQYIDVDFMDVFGSLVVGIRQPIGIEQEQVLLYRCEIKDETVSKRLGGHTSRAALFQDEAVCACLTQDDPTVDTVFYRHTYSATGALIQTVYIDSYKKSDTTHYTYFPNSTQRQTVTRIGEQRCSEGPQDGQSIRIEEFNASGQRVRLHDYCQYSDTTITKIYEDWEYQDGRPVQVKGEYFGSQRTVRIKYDAKEQVEQVAISRISRWSRHDPVVVEEVLRWSFENNQLIAIESGEEFMRRLEFFWTPWEASTVTLPACWAPFVTD